MADRLILPRAVDANDDPVSGAELFVFEAGTSTPKTTYQDTGLTTPHASPVVADSSGDFAAVFLSGQVKIDIRTPEGASLFGGPLDNWVTTSITGGAAGDVSFSPDGTNTATNVQEAIEGTVYKGGTIGPTATTSGPSVDFTSIPAGVTRVELLLNGVGTDGTGSFIVEIGDSGGLETSGYVNSTSGEISAGATQSSSSGFPIRVGGGANVNGTLVLSKGAGDDWHASGTFGATGGLSIVAGGSKTLSDALDRVRLRTTGGDSFDSGSATVRWSFA